MKIFKLPDLGEGLPDAEIREWLIKEGDDVKTDQPVVAMETAKAVVDVPAPRAGIISKFYGQAGDVINTGDPLFEYETDDASSSETSEPTPATQSSSQSKDAGTVVGNITVGSDVITEAATGVHPTQGSATCIRALPAARQLARKFDIDIANLSGTGRNGMITIDDVQKQINIQPSQTTAGNAQPPSDYTALRGVRRMMARSMAQSHAQIVPVTISDEANIHCWNNPKTITERVVRALILACQTEPSLNSWFDTASLSRKIFKEVHLGLAMDSEEGLFVPVIHDAQNCSPEALRQTINQYKEEVKSRSIAQDKLKGNTITLSNFGMFAGRYANPIIVPPTVCIIGTGKIYETCIARNGQAEMQRCIPLSLTFDHRAVTGGEATRFLGAMIADLEKTD